MTAPFSVEISTKRDRIVILLGLTSLTILAWFYMIYLAWNMSSMDMQMDVTMPHMQAWGLVELGSLFLMWVIMMIAMMIPSASPMILMYSKTLRSTIPKQSIFAQIGMFVLGYLVVWTGFSALITLVQWGLHEAALLSAMMVSTSNLLSGILLVIAGIFQWTPLKHVCLRHCRSPLSFLMTQWREGTGGAFVMGLHHGLFCVGCCWALMALLFVAGVMNLLWIAAIAVLVLIEKVIPAGDKLARLIGVLMVAYGIVILADIATN